MGNFHYRLTNIWINKERLLALRVTCYTELDSFSPFPRACPLTEAQHLLCSDGDTSPSVQVIARLTVKSGRSKGEKNLSKVINVMNFTRILKSMSPQTFRVLRCN